MSAPAAPQRSLFDATHLQTGLGRRAVRGGGLMLGSLGLRLLLGVVSAAILARLLEPDDFGLVAMVSAILILVSEIRGLGLSAATIQRHEISHEQVSTLFWVNSVFGLVLSLLIAGLAPVLAAFYGEHRLIGITLALSPVFFISGLGVQHDALLRRTMQLGRIAIIAVIAEVVGLAVGVIAASFGASYWSLVWMRLATAGAMTVCSMVACPWYPGPPKRCAGAWSMLAFGSHLTGANLIRALAERADSILIGRFVGAAALGYYNRGFFLLVTPISRLSMALQSVGVPALSRLQNEPAWYRSFYRNALELIASVTIPATLFAAVAAEPIVHVLLGERWSDTVPIFRAIAPLAMIVSLGFATSWVYESTGRAKRLLAWTAIRSVFILLAYGFALFMGWGALGVAVAASTIACALWPYSLAYCFRGTPLKQSDVWSVVWRPGLATTVASAAVWFVLHWWSRQSEAIEWLVWLTRLGVAMVVFSVIYVSAWLASPGGATRLRAMTKHLRELRPRAVPPSSPESETLESAS